MLTARYRQSAEDRLRYTIKMDDWLGATETLAQIRRIDTQVDVFITDEIVVDPTTRKAFTFFASGGRPGAIIPVRFLVLTNSDQQRTVELEFGINWPRGLPMLPPGTTPPPPPPPGGGGGLDVGVFTPGDNTGNCPI